MSSKAISSDGCLPKQKFRDGLKKTAEIIPFDNCHLPDIDIPAYLTILIRAMDCVPRPAPPYRKRRRCAATCQYVMHCRRFLRQLAHAQKLF